MRRNSSSDDNQHFQCSLRVSALTSLTSIDHVVRFVFILKCSQFFVGSLKGSYWASERLLDDIMIRKFVDGVMHGFVQSEVVIKRKANRISLVFLVSKELDIVKFYFLVGFTEKLLTELLGCVVKIEPQSVYS